MSTTRNIPEICQTNVIYGSKIPVTALKCYRDTQILKKQKEKSGKCKITSPAIHIIIKTVQDKICGEKKKSRSKTRCDTRTSLKSIHSRSTGIHDKKKIDKKKIDRCEKSFRLIFPEMRGGVLYSRCYCLHRNGLQDYCPLSQCQGRPECLTKPWPVCPPGKFVRLRHPELYPKESNNSC